MLYKVLQWFVGKKTYIFSILSATNAFIGSKGAYDLETVSYVQLILGIIFTGAEYKTQQLGINRK